MRYKEFLVKNSEGRLGILGEDHLYTSKESDFARRIIRDFNVIAVEGSNKYSLISYIGLTFFPSIIAYTVVTNKSFDNKTLRDIAEEIGKDIIHLEDDKKGLYPLKQIIAMGLFGLLCSITSPHYYFYLKKYGDPYKKGTIAYERRIKQKEKKTLVSRLENYAFKSNLGKRDDLMAQKTIQLIRAHKNLLVNVGDDHLEGIINNISKELNLEEIKSIEIN